MNRFPTQQLKHWLHRIALNKLRRPRSSSRAGFSGRVFYLQKHNVALFAIPKNANTALQDLIHQAVSIDMPNNLNDLYRLSKTTQPLFDEPELRRFVHESGILTSKQEIISVPGVRKLAVVRDPFHRALSCWRDKIRAPGYTEGAIIGGVHSGFAVYGSPFWANMTFREFMESVSKIPSSKANPHFRQQVDFIFDQESNCLVDKLIRHENFTDDLLPLMSKWTGMDFEIRRLNTSGSSLRSSAEDVEEARPLVAEYYREDYRLLGYKP